VDSIKGGKSAGSRRDCDQFQGAFCTVDEPCTPCDDPDAEACASCSSNGGGYCSFQPGIGPYCRFNIGNGTEAEEAGRGLLDFATGQRYEIKACERCCTLDDTAA